MLKCYDFTCTNGHTHEVFLKEVVEEVPCPTCGLPAKRQLSAPRAKLEGYTGAFPGAAMAWERKHAEKLAQEQKITREHGPQKW